MGEEEWKSERIDAANKAVLANDAAGADALAGRFDVEMCDVGCVSMCVPCAHVPCGMTKSAIDRRHHLHNPPPVLLLLSL